jgi:hypothetical protein
MLFQHLDRQFRLRYTAVCVVDKRFVCGRYDVDKSGSKIGLVCLDLAKTTTCVVVVGVVIDLPNPTTVGV